MLIFVGFNYFLTVSSVFIEREPGELHFCLKLFAKAKLGDKNIKNGKIKKRSVPCINFRINII